MKTAIGIDAVEIQRFAHWHSYSCHQLRRIFSDPEIDYCLSSPALSAQRFAARFAAREALLKALSCFYPTLKFSLLALCKNIAITHSPNGSPQMAVQWAPLIPHISEEYWPNCNVSWTHDKSTAIAIIQLSDILQKN